MSYFWLLFLSLLMTNVSLAKVDQGFSDTLPTSALKAEDLQRSSNRNITDILNQTPSLSTQQFQQGDALQVRLRLSTNLSSLKDRFATLSNKKNDLYAHDFLSQSTELTQSLIERIDSIDKVRSLYGTDALSGVVDQIKSWKIHPQELPEQSQWSSQELAWSNEHIPFGRIGITPQNGQLNWGLSVYDQNKWSWTPSYGVGEWYGLSGPIVALGKTPKGPALSIYDAKGIFRGDVNATKLSYDPLITTKYEMTAQYASFKYPQMMSTYKPSEFNPYGVFIQPFGQTMGDTFQFSNQLNQGLYRFDSYDSYMDDMQQPSCTKPSSSELVFPRHILKKKKVVDENPIVPNDPLYQQQTIVKKVGIPLISGIIGGITGSGDTIAVKGDPNGPKIQDQYNLPQIGFRPTSDTSSAWNKVDSHSKNIIVAIIDSGLDLTHPDGPAFIWQNAQEISDNGIDDDSNGYIDDIHGWNFLEETNDLADYRGHGTVVAGIIAAKTNNGQGIAGINPGAIIMPLKVADKLGNTNSLHIFRAIHYAVANGARVINISLGARGASRLEQLAINYARTHGVVIVVASGNDGDDMGDYGPASTAQAISVGALNADGTRSTVSNWGANNSLMAPGEEIYSLQSKDAPWEGPSGQKERLYTKMSGTSFSSPMVAATASLLRVKNPQLNPDQIEDILLSTAQRLDTHQWDSKTGAGLLDAVAALAHDGQGTFNIKFTGIKINYKAKSKQVESVDVYATVRGDVDYFMVELGKGKRATQFKPIVGISGQQANHDLVAHIQESQLRGSQEWLIQLKAKDKSGKDWIAQTPVTFK